MGCPEAFPIPEKKADTIFCVFLNNNLPIHMCPHFKLSDNGTEFKIQLMDNTLQQLGINGILSAPYHSQSNGKLEVFQKSLKPSLTTLCQIDLDNWDNTSTKYLHATM